MRHLGLKPTAQLRDQRSPRASPETDTGAGEDLHRERRAAGKPKRRSFLGEKVSGRKGASDGDGNEGEEEEEEEEEHIIYAHDLPDDKLVGLLGACPRTPKAMRKDPAALLVSSRQGSLHGRQPTTSVEPQLR